MWDFISSISNEKTAQSMLICFVEDFIENESFNQGDLSFLFLIDRNVPSLDADIFIPCRLVKHCQRNFIWCNSVIG